MLYRFAIDFLGHELTSNIRRWRAYRRNYKSGHFARAQMDKKLEKFLPHENGFYVELGANDGAIASNSYFLSSKKVGRGY